MTISVHGNEIHFNGTLCAYIVAPLNEDDAFRAAIEEADATEGLCEAISDTVENLETAVEGFDHRCEDTKKCFKALQAVIEQIKENQISFEALAQFEKSLEAFDDCDFIDLHWILSEASKASEDLARVLE